MPLQYPKRTIGASRMLEELAAVLLLPFKQRPDGSPVRRILLVEPFGMGDVLSLSVMLDPLKQKFPAAAIRLLLKEGNEEIYAADARIERVYAIPVPWSKLSGQKKGSPREWLKIWRVCREIAQWSPDCGLDSRSEIRSQILMVLAGCRRRIGFRNYLNTNINVQGRLLTDRVAKPPVLNRYIMNRLLVEKGFGIDPQPIRFPSFRPEVTAENLIPGARQVLVHIGARWRYRQWAEKNWIELGKQLTAAGVYPVIAGSVDEQNAVARIADSICGATAVCADMQRLIRLVKGSDLFIGLDSGPMHLARTMGVPVVALFGPGDVELWCPQGELDQVLFHRFPCNPCLQKTCIRPDDYCMMKVAVEEVFAAVQRVLRRLTD